MTLRTIYARRLLPLLIALSGLLFSVAPARAFDEDHKEAINGTTLHFRVRGEDKTHPYLLVLHGGPGFSAHMFYPWGPSVEKTVNVVYLDQRGSGESDRLKFISPFAPTTEEAKDYTIANLVRDIEGVRAFLHIDRWFVLGHSWGGMLGLEYVAAHPEHTLGYIHMDGAVSFRQIQDDVLNNAEKKFKEQVQSDDATKKSQAGPLLQQVAELRALPPDNPQRLFGGFGLAMGPAGLYFAKNPATAFQSFGARIAAAVKPYNIPPAGLGQASEPIVALMKNDKLLTRDDTPLLAKITVPTLVINGKQDGVVTPRMAETVQRGIKDAKLVLLDDCGHFPFAEQPEKTTAAVLDFVKTTH